MLGLNSDAKPGRHPFAKVKGGLSKLAITANSEKWRQSHGVCAPRTFEFRTQITPIDLLLVNFSVAFITLLLCFIDYFY